MRGYHGLLPWVVLLSSLGTAQARLDLNSSTNMVIYWGQNSGGKGQQDLSYYCSNDDIDVIPLAFDMMINGTGGAPEIDFSTATQDCDVFPGTQLKNCPSIGTDIATCQQNGKTILLSIGGATYSEGGFSSDSDAVAGANLMWETFGPKQSGSNALRPFGDVALDGFDFDFEANVQNMAAFATQLRTLMDAETDKQYFLTAAPQCPYPDQSDEQILNGPVYMDAVWVQFYNNYCGVQSFSTDSNSSQFNFDQWNDWAKNVSKNPDVKVMVGVPADSTAAGSGYEPAAQLKPVIQYSQQFSSFGGIMMWDMAQAYSNPGFISDVRSALGPDAGSSGDSSSSSSSSASNSASSSSSSTNSSNTSTSSNAPGSASSFSSSPGSGASSGAPEGPGASHPTKTHHHVHDKPPHVNPPDLPDLPHIPKPQLPPKPHHINLPEPTDAPSYPPVPKLLGTDLFGLLDGLRLANTPPALRKARLHAQRFRA